MSYQNVTIPLLPDPNSNPNNKPIQINLRIFLNQHQNHPEPVLIARNPPPIIPQNSISLHYQAHSQPNFQRNPIYMSPTSPVAYHSVNQALISNPIYHPVASTPRQFDRIMQNQHPKVASVQNNKFQTTQYFQTYLPTTTEQKSIPKHQNSQPSSQKQSLNKSHNTQIVPQTPIKCPICLQFVYKNTHKQHEQHHRNRISNITYIPKYQAKQNNIPVYSKEDLIQILFEYEERIKDKVIKEIKNGDKLNAISNQIKIQDKITERPASQEKPDKNEDIHKLKDDTKKEGEAFFLGTQDRFIQKDVILPMSHVNNRQPFPFKQITSPNISNVHIQDQSECFSQLDLLQAPFLQKVSSQQPSQLQMPLSSAEKPNSPQLLPQKIPNNNAIIPEYQHEFSNNQSSYYKTLISEIRSGSQFSKKKKLPSNIMAFDTLKKQ